MYKLMTKRTTYVPLRSHIAHAAFAVFCSLTLLVSFPLQAFCAPTSKQLEQAKSSYNNAEAALAAAEQKLQTISEEYETLSAEVDKLQKEINQMAVQVLNSQAKMLEGRSALATTAAHEYRNSSVSGLLTSLLHAQSWQELARNVDYAAKIMQQQSEEVAQQKELKDTFEQASKKLTEQKNQQDEKLIQLNKKRSEAAQVVDEAAQYVDSSSKKLASLKQQAEQFIWKTDTPEQENDPSATTPGRTDVIPPTAPVVPDPKPSTSTSGDYKSGIASAYGGSSDKNTPNPGKTATGAICDDNSMGVAIPTSLPNYRSYYGRTVEIVYNGKKVYATVNDCGNMGGGSRVLDLQPGVFKAFGYPDCFAWGLRTVKYRFL